MAVRPKEQGEDDALQNAVSSPLDNYINSVSVNALAVKPGEHGDDIAAIQKADAALAAICELDLAVILWQISRHNLLTSHVQTQLPRSPLAGRGPNPRPSELRQSRL